METNRPKIKEAIVVEGRDDTIAVLSALNSMTIETHGFGIKKETWELLEKAYNEKGLIVFTDPDFSGEEIRKKIMARFPNAKQAFLTVKDASKKGDIGIENASPSAILKAIENAHCTTSNTNDTYTEEDIIANDLSGTENSKERREKLAKVLGIGYGNSKALLKKLNQFNISKEDFKEALKKI